MIWMWKKPKLTHQTKIVIKTSWWQKVLATQLPNFQPTLAQTSSLKWKSHSLRCRDRNITVITKNWNLWARSLTNLKINSINIYSKILAKKRWAESKNSFWYQSDFQEWVNQLWVDSSVPQAKTTSTISWTKT